MEVYRDVFNGDWESFDPFCVKGRGLANMDENCSFFRAFQGTYYCRVGKTESLGPWSRVIVYCRRVRMYMVFRILSSVPKLIDTK